MSPDARRRVVALLAWLACTAATLTMIGGTTRVEVDPDEIYWIGSAYYYHLAFDEGDLRGAHPDWGLMPARENPPAAKYVLGLGLAVRGHHVTTPDLLGSFYAYFTSILGAPDAEHAARQREVMQRMDPALYERVSRRREMYIAPELLRAARRVVLACGVVTSLLVFVFGASISSYATGLVASQLVLVHPAVTFAYQHAMADAVGIMFGTAAAFATWHLYKCFAATTVGTTAVTSGFLLGLAVATKMNWLTVAFLFVATLLAVAVQSWRRGDRSRAWLAVRLGVIGSLTAFLVFVLINPAIVADPIDGLVAVIREPQRTTLVQARILTNQTYLTSLGPKLGAVASLTVGTQSALGAAIFAALLLGVAVSVVRAPRTGTWFVAAWWAIAFACVTAWIPFAWQRYALPVVIPFALLVAHALVAAASALLRRRHAIAA